MLPTPNELDAPGPLARPHRREGELDELADLSELEVPDFPDFPEG